MPTFFCLLVGGGGGDTAVDTAFGRVKEEE